MSDRQFVEQLRAGPGMYGLNGTYHPTAMLLVGFDLARDGGLLRGFREWLTVRSCAPGDVMVGDLDTAACPGACDEDLAEESNIDMA